jgi:hypothetical protein
MTEIELVPGCDKASALGLPATDTVPQSLMLLSRAICVAYTRAEVQRAFRRVDCKLSRNHEGVGPK